MGETVRFGVSLDLDLLDEFEDDAPEPVDLR